MGSYTRSIEAMTPEDRAAHIAWALEERRCTEALIEGFAREEIPDKVERAYRLASIDQHAPYPSLPKERT